MRALFIIILALALASCGPQAKLRRAERLIREAVAQGATYKRDTVVITKEVIVPGDSTTITVKEYRDTVVYQDRIRVEIQRDTIRKTVKVRVQCPPDTVKIRVPVYIKEEISCPPPSTTWRTVALVLAGIIALVILFLARLKY